MKPESLIKQKRWSYLAAFFDGDGTFCITAHPHEANYTNYDVHVGIGTTHRPTANWFVQQFGGRYYVTQDKRPNRKPNHHWYVSSSPHQLSLLSGMRSELVLKKKQCALLTDFLSLGGRHFQNPLVREEMFQASTILNDYYEPVVKDARPAQLCRDKRAFPYFAGLIDAEGCISMYESRRSFDPKLQFANSDNRAFNWILENFGGCVSLDRRGPRIRGRWGLPVEFMEQTLLATIPYLVTKRQQGIRLLEWFRHRRELTDQEHRTEIEWFRVANKRGLSPTTNTANCPEIGQMIESDLHGDMQREQAVMSVSN